MVGKYRLDIKNIKKEETFIINVETLENDSNLHISLECIATVCNTLMRENKFRECLELIKQAKKLKGYQNNLLFNTEHLVKVKEASYLLSNFDGDLFKDIFEVKKAGLESFWGASLNARINVSDELITEMKILNNLIKKIDLNKSLINLKGDIKKGNFNIKVLAILKELLNDHKKYKVDEVELKKVEERYELGIEMSIEKLKKSTSKLIAMRKFYEGFRTYDYIISKEFIYVVQNINKVKCYSDLEEMEEKCYKLYKYKNSTNLSEKVLLLAELKVKEYQRLPIIYKEKVADTIGSNFSNIDEFILQVKKYSNQISDSLKNINVVVV